MRFYCIFSPLLPVRAFLVAAVAVTISFSSQGAATTGPRSIDFNRDIQPILSDNCYACHGPDSAKRKAGLRLDEKVSPFQKLESGKTAIVAGKPESSELLNRITTADEDDRMPPVKSTKQLTPQQIETLRQWIAQGAEWKPHWSFIKPQKPAPPAVQNKNWTRNALDLFILQRLEQAGIQPSREADRSKLIRRLSLDLTGLPPTLEEVRAFLRDRSSDAYEKLVDRLLASPRFGERMAQFWLDVARFADTNGYHIDNHRDIWLWRDWIIQAFNRNLPFDQFTIEQLAGDLLPEPTESQKIATGFNRNEMVNFEGGADPNEYAVKYVVGRVDTTSRAFLGLTMACAECHDHKYDPISQKEYYEFFAFFNTISEKGLDGNEESPVPRMKAPKQIHQARSLEYKAWVKEAEAAKESALNEKNSVWEQEQQKWMDKNLALMNQGWNQPVPKIKGETDGASKVHKEEIEFTPTPERTNLVTLVQLPAGKFKGLKINLSALGEVSETNFILTSVELTARSLQQPSASPLRWSSWHMAGPFKTADAKEAFSKVHDPEKGVDLKASYQDGKLSWTNQSAWVDGQVQKLEGENSAFYLHRTVETSAEQDYFVSLGSDDGIQVWVNHKRVLSKDVARSAGADQEKVRLHLKQGTNELLIKISNGGGEGGFYFKPADQAASEYKVDFDSAMATSFSPGNKPENAIDEKPETGWSFSGGEKGHSLILLAGQAFGFSNPSEMEVQLRFNPVQSSNNTVRLSLSVSPNEDLEQLLAVPEKIRQPLFARASSESGSKEIQRYHRQTFVPEVKEKVTKFDRLKSEQTQFEKIVPVTMVMQEMEKPRPTHLLVRGDWQTKGDVVTPGTPKIFPSLPANAPTNRLALARWLVSPDHPLTSRVTVNRFWQHYFGNGIVKTADDFGAQGEWPSHPELLDYLATSFIESGWDMKALQKLIVMSATYRQETWVDPKVLEKDPENRLLARGPRFRLDAEAIRDQALAVSGMLNDQIGGPSVYPYQPPGLWEAIGFTDNGNFSSQKYSQSKGRDNHRRGLYTYWKRSMPYASFVTFDAPNRETCTVKRPRTNTPLQSLVLMNDPVYVEAARGLGQRIMTEGGRGLERRIRFAFELCLGRKPSQQEVEIIGKIYREQLEQFSQDRDAAKKFTSIGEFAPPPDLDIAELAAWTSVGNVILNLDEWVTKG